MTLDYEAVEDFIKYIDKSKAGTLSEMGLVENAPQSAIDAFQAYLREMETSKKLYSTNKNPT
jgi:hypothetical protein